MKKFLNNYLSIILIIFAGAFLLTLYFKFNTTSYLSFSDGAKFAIIARNLVEGRGYGSDFSFYSPNLLTSNLTGLFGVSGIPVLIPYLLSFFFKLFGVKDLSVILFSGTFYVLTVLLTYLLGKKIFGNLTGILSSLAVAANIDFLNYATSGASEVVYTFFALVSALLIFINKKWADVLFFVSLAFLYLTRPQGIVFIGVFIFVWLLMRFSVKKAVIYFLTFILGLFALDKLILYPLSFKYPVYPIVTRGIQALFQYSPGAAVSDALRGGTGAFVSWKEVIIKTFYNIYNFYKLLPAIASPYMWGLFIIGAFMWGKDKTKNLFKVLTILIFLGSFLLTALTIPFYRYLHPVVPFVYILGAATLVEILSKVKASNKYFLPVVSTAIILIFTVGQTLGVIFLDSRFENANHNIGKPPVYVKLAQILKDNTQSGMVVITNLDTWGSWYGERKTVWFPLAPKQLIDPKTGKIPFDAIYLTSYLMDDQNYYMGADWREIFLNQNDSKKWICDGCSEIAKEFKLKGVYKVAANEDYEKQDATAVLLIKK